jgi:hypothetical protein
MRCLLYLMKCLLLELVQNEVVQYEVVKYVTLRDTTRAGHMVLQPGQGGWVQFTKYFTYTGWGIRHGQGKWCYNAANGGWVQFTCADSQRTYRCRLVVALAFGANKNRPTYRCLIGVALCAQAIALGPTCSMCGVAHWRDTCVFSIESALVIASSTCTYGSHDVTDVW